MVFWCLSDYDNCANHPCMNGATCVDGVNLYTCTCPDGYVGHSCETSTFPCFALLVSFRTQNKGFIKWT